MIERELIRRRDLPHWDVPGASYFVTTCLEGNIPAQGLVEMARFREELRQIAKPKELTEAEWKALCWKRSFVRLEKWLDRSPGRRDLENPALAKIVVNSMHHFAEERYDLFAYVVMPNHIHWLFRPLPGWIEGLTDDDRSPRERITYSLNRFTATACNRLMHVKGPFWQTESYDHWPRDADEMERIIRYIEENPVMAGLVAKAEDWPFSSARARMVAGIGWGEPLSKRVSGLES